MSLRLLLLVAAACCCAPLARAQKLSEPRSEHATTEMDQSKARTGGKAGTGSIEARLGYYDNSDNGDGNPFLDESLSVVEPIIYFDYNFDERLSIWTKGSFDLVSSASIDRLSKFPQQSGATGDYYIGITAGLNYKDSELLRYGVWGHASFEYDYRSFGIGGSLAWDAEDRSSTNKIAANVFFDSLDLIRFNGVQTGSDDRLSLTATFTRYQVLTPEMHAEFGATLTHQDGFLGTPYNAVVILNPALPPNPNLANMARGEEVSERMPSTRTRFAVFGKLRHHLFESSAAEIGGRIYADTWGVTSLSLEPHYYTWLVQDRLSTDLRYRYYTQTAADDYRENFYEADRNRRYFTQDSDLGDYDSHSLGAGLRWIANQDVSVALDSDYVLRSDGLDYYYLSLGLAWSF